MASHDFQSYNPIRVRLHGDQFAAKSLVRFGQAQVNLLENQMSHQGLKQSYREVEPFPGVIVNVGSSHGQRWMDIYVPPAVMVDERPEFVVPDYIITTPCCASYFHAECQIVGLSTKDGGYLDDDSGPARSYDILICIKTTEREVPEIGFTQLVENVRPSDYTRYQPGDHATLVGFYDQEWDDFFLDTTVTRAEFEGITSCLDEPPVFTSRQTSIIPGIGRSEDIYNYWSTQHIHAVIVPVGRAERAENRQEDGSPAYSYNAILCTDQQYATLYFYSDNYTASQNIAFPRIVGKHQFSRSVHDEDETDWQPHCMPPCGDIAGATSFRVLCFRPPWYEDAGKRITLEDYTSQEFAGGSYVFPRNGYHYVIYMRWTGRQCLQSFKDMGYYTDAHFGGIILGPATYRPYDPEDWLGTVLPKWSVPAYGIKRVPLPIPSMVVFFAYYGHVEYTGDVETMYAQDYQDFDATAPRILDAVDLLTGERPFEVFIKDTGAGIEYIEFPYVVEGDEVGATFGDSIANIFAFHNDAFPTRSVPLDAVATSSTTMVNPSFETQRNILVRLHLAAYTAGFTEGEEAGWEDNNSEPTAVPFLDYMTGKLEFSSVRVNFDINYYYQYTNPGDNSQYRMYMVGTVGSGASFHEMLDAEPQYSVEAVSKTFSCGGVTYSAVNALYFASPGSSRYLAGSFGWGIPGEYMSFTTGYIAHRGYPTPTHAYNGYPSSAVSSLYGYSDLFEVCGQYQYEEYPYDWRDAYEGPEYLEEENYAFCDPKPFFILNRHGKVSIKPVRIGSSGGICRYTSHVYTIRRSEHCGGDETESSTTLTGETFETLFDSLPGYDLYHSRPTFLLHSRSSGLNGSSTSYPAHTLHLILMKARRHEVARSGPTNSDYTYTRKAGLATGLSFVAYQYFNNANNNGTWTLVSAHLGGTFHTFTEPWTWAHNLGHADALVESIMNEALFARLGVYSKQDFLYDYDYPNYAGSAEDWYETDRHVQYLPSGWSNTGRFVV